MALELKPGVVLNQTYRLVEIIGKGGMGEVWRARHERLPKEVAVKVLLASTLDQESHLERFRREAEIATQLGHPNIVEVLDWNTLVGGTPYMVMELLAGESLRDRLRRGPLPMGTLVPILRQVGSALAEAHRHGVVHRDLKPENIFLVVEPGPDGPVERAKVLDFGISKIQGRETALTQESEVLGTPVYMAPEQAAGRLGKVSGATDQFALAAIAYEALSGTIAFSGHTLIEVLARILEDDPAPLQERARGLPEHVYTAVSRALSKRPDERFETVTAFVDALAGGRATGALQPVLLATGLDDSVVGEVPSSLDARAPRHPRHCAPRHPRQETGGHGQGEIGDSLSRSGDLKTPESAFAATMASASSRDAAAGLASGGSITGTEGTVAMSTALGGQQVGGQRSRSFPWLWVGGTALVAAAAVMITVILTRPGGSSTAPGKTTSEGELAVRGSGIPAEGRAAPARRVAPDGGMGSTASTEEKASESDPSSSDPPRAEKDSGARVLADAGALISGDPRDTSPMESPRAGAPRAPARGVTPPPEPRPPARPEALPPAVVERLGRARQAIARGAYSDGLHLARSSLVQHRTQEAYFLMIQAYCGLKDLRNAIATHGNLTSRALRQRAVRWCGARDIHLTVK